MVTPRTGVWTMDVQHAQHAARSAQHSQHTLAPTHVCTRHLCAHAHLPSWVLMSVSGFSCLVCLAHCGSLVAAPGCLVAPLPFAHGQRVPCGVEMNICSITIFLLVVTLFWPGFVFLSSVLCPVRDILCVPWKIYIVFLHRTVNLVPTIAHGQCF